MSPTQKAEAVSVLAETSARPALVGTGFRWRSTLEGVLIPVGAVVGGFILFGVFCATQGASPFSVFAAIYKAAFGSWYSWQNTLVRTSPLLLTALCTALPARLGLVVIGNEGALVVGGVAAVSAGLALAAFPMLVMLVGMALAAMLCGGLWIAAVGALYYQRGVNETISSLLMNYIAIALMNHLVNGPMRDPSSLNKPSSFPIPDDKMIPTMGASNVHYGLLLGIAACLLVWVLMEHTTFGFKVRMIGGNIRAARMAACRSLRLDWPPVSWAERLRGWRG